MDLGQDEQTLINVLTRRTSGDALSALMLALRADAPVVGLMQTAIGFDSSSFLRLGSHRKSEDILDYLRSQHLAPLVLPGQAIQEFWNNQLQAVETIATKVKGKFDAFQSELKRAEPFFESYAEKIDELLEEFRTQHGHIYDEATIRKTGTVLDLLKQRAIVSYAPRLQLAEVAAYRKRTKTPPGFKDDGDGDFFIWADFLTGLQMARARGDRFSRAVLVTRDVKLDWSRSGIAHPILSAEIKALLDIPFEIWGEDKLASEIDRALAGGNAPP